MSIIVHTLLSYFSVATEPLEGGSSDEIFIDDAARREKERIARGAREERGRKKLLREARVEEGFDWPSPIPSTKQDRRFRSLTAGRIHST